MALWASALCEDYGGFYLALLDAGFGEETAKKVALARVRAKVFVRTYYDEPIRSEREPSMAELTEEALLFMKGNP